MAERLAWREGSAGQPGAQRLPFEQFRDDVRRSVMSADVVDRQDVGVVQGSGGARFLLKAS